MVVPFGTDTVRSTPGGSSTPSLEKTAEPNLNAIVAQTTSTNSIMKYLKNLNPAFAAL